MKKIYLLMMSLLIAQSVKSGINLSGFIQTTFNAAANNFELNPYANTLICGLGAYCFYYFSSNVEEKYAFSKDKTCEPMISKWVKAKEQPSSSESETVMELKNFVDTDRLAELRLSWNSFLKHHTIFDNNFRLPMLGIALLALNNRFGFIK